MEIKRDFYLNKLIEGLNNGLVKIVIWIRRCDKSYLLDPIFKNCFNVNDFFKKIIIVGDNIKKSRYENGIIIMSIYDFLLDLNSLEY